VSVPNSFLLPEWLLCNFLLSAFISLNLPLCAPALWIMSIPEYDHSNQTARLPLFSLQSAYRPTSQPASWFRFPHTTHPNAQRELARPASGRTARHPAIRSTGQYPSDQFLAIRPGNEQASDGLANLWPSSQRPNNKNSIKRSRRPLANHNKPNNMNRIKKFGHTVAIHNTPNNSGHPQYNQ
jgi:hypothetical protein